MARFDLIKKDGKNYIRELNDRVESEFGPFETIMAAMKFIHARKKQIAAKIGQTQS